MMSTCRVYITLMAGFMIGSKRTDIKDIIACLLSSAAIIVMYSDQIKDGFVFEKTAANLLVSVAAQIVLSGRDVYSVHIYNNPNLSSTVLEYVSVTVIVRLFTSIPVDKIGSHTTLANMNEMISFEFQAWICGAMVFVSTISYSYSYYKFVNVSTFIGPSLCATFVMTISSIINIALYSYKWKWVYLISTILSSISLLLTLCRRDDSPSTLSIEDKNHRFVAPAPVAPPLHNRTSYAPSMDTITSSVMDKYNYNFGALQDDEKTYSDDGS